MRTPRGTALRARDVLPSPPSEETMVAASDQLSSILQRDTECRLRRLPMVQHRRGDIPSICADALCAVDPVPWLELSQLSMGSVGHQDRRHTLHAINAGMGAAPIRVDRPAERHPRTLRDPVDRRARLHLVETDAKRLGRIERAGHRLTQSGEQALRAGSFLEVVPTHERMFANASDAPPPACRRSPGSSSRSRCRAWGWSARSWPRWRSRGICPTPPRAWRGRRSRRPRPWPAPAPLAGASDRHWSPGIPGTVPRPRVAAAHGARTRPR